MVIININYYSLLTITNKLFSSYSYLGFKGNGPKGKSKDELEEMEQLNLLSITLQLSHIVRRDQASCGDVVEQANNAHT